MVQSTNVQKPLKSSEVLHCVVLLAAKIFCTYLSDWSTAFMKHVFPRFRKPTVFGWFMDFRFLLLLV